MSNFTPVFLPQSGPNDVVATIAAWFKPPGQPVRKGEVVGSAETTKSVFDVEAPAAGVFWPLAAVGAEVQVGALIAALGDEQSTAAGAQAWRADQVHAQTGVVGSAGTAGTAGAPPSMHQGQSERTGAGGSAGLPAGREGGETAGAMPRPSTLKAELLARRQGIDLAQVPAAGEKITEADVQAYLAAHAGTGGSIAATQTAANENRAAATGTVAPSTGTAAANPHDLVDGRFPANRPQRILIIGGGNGAVQIIDVLARLPHQRAVAILDDNTALHGREVAGIPIMGAIDVARAGEMAAAGQFDAAVISISTSIPARARIFEQWKSRGITFANVIHPTCAVGLNVQWGEGNVVMAFCHFGACAVVGDNNFLSAYCSIEHHNQLGSHCSFGPAVVTSSRVQIGDRVRFGTGIHVEPGIRIGADSVIASGLAITQHIPPQSLLKAHVHYSIRPR
jgi:sugar O-acyltransferase (sialic acid O-acetyltransferase NeuD family)